MGERGRGKRGMATKTQEHKKERRKDKK